ncbi:hypothetical protein A3D11_00235 [Candidatus Peribacteria bacterium RIFCSPHIGHO2_02_FULL_49_16]|nr:MAG: hypothetical protein A3D11_00235 [Candidatus Peribacteria bacterium RIFCSPHIGHO2_02_FULL_49_16]
MNIIPIKTRLFKQGEEIVSFILIYLPRLKDGSILVITSKIVALSEGRVMKETSEKEKEKVIRQESTHALKTKRVWLTIKDGMLIANAGIDDSNGNGKLVLLPEDSFKSAAFLRKEVMKTYKIKRLGVIISDSVVMPLRAGVVGIALGYAGFKGVRDYRGKKDLFGRKFKFSQTDVADSLATAAALVMGEGAERKPLAVISDAPVIFSIITDKKEIQISIKDDMYKPLLSVFKKRRR